MNAATRALLVVAALLSTAPVSARRVPAPGGKATMSLPPDLLQPTTDAHLYLALLEPMGPTELARALAHPALPDLPTWRSSVIGSLKSEGGGRAWRTTSKVSARTLSDALERCLAVDVHAESWPADVLRARGVRPTIEVAGDDVVVRLSAPVGPMPELLSGCLLRGRAATTPTGPYMLAAPGVLTWRNVGLDEPPLLGVVELKSAGGRADLMGGSPDSISAGMLLAPFPDVVLLLQSSASLRADWFGMRDPNIGPRGFRQSLRADLLVAAYGAGRGTAAQGLLPPGIAPARQLPSCAAPTSSYRSPCRCCRRTRRA